MVTTLDKIKIGISSCLLGERVRFDGGHKQNHYILNTLGRYFHFRPFCPELAIGLGVPRQTLRLIDVDGRIQAVGNTDPNLNVTDALVQTAHAQGCWHHNIFGYIVKKDSPSCGMERVRVYRNNQAQRNGNGLYTSTMRRNFPYLPIEEEGRLNDPILCEAFVKQVYAYYRWRQLLDLGISWASLNEFHARHKYILYSHSQDRGRKLGRELAAAHSKLIEDYAPVYFAEFMAILRIYSRRSNHVNVLEHIRGYLKKDLDRSDKREITASIKNYRLGLLPLIVPITLLRHYFRKYPNHYIGRSYYLQPHPDALMLLNSI